MYVSKLAALNSLQSCGTDNSKAGFTHQLGYPLQAAEERLIFHIFTIPEEAAQMTILDEHLAGLRSSPQYSTKQ